MNSPLGSNRFPSAISFWKPTVSTVLSHLQIHSHLSPHPGTTTGFKGTLATLKSEKLLEPPSLTRFLSCSSQHLPSSLPPLPRPLLHGHLTHEPPSQWRPESLMSTSSPCSHSAQPGALSAQAARHTLVGFSESSPKDCGLFLLPQ